MFDGKKTSFLHLTPARTVGTRSLVIRVLTMIPISFKILRQLGVLQLGANHVVDIE